MNNGHLADEMNNKKIIERVIVEVLNRGDYSIVGELFADTLVEHDPNQAESATALEAFIIAVQSFRSAFPDNVTVIEAQVAEGDLVVTRWSMTGTHLGEFMGVPASGCKVEVTGIFFDRLHRGRIVETWANYDLYGLFQQIK